MRSSAVVLAVAIGASACGRESRVAAQVPLDPPSPATIASGVLITPSGVVAPILGAFGAGAGHWVRTPCFGIAAVWGGEVVGRVDVVLDPGHGGEEQGAVAADGLQEKTVNAAVAARAAMALRARGFTVALTRSGDTWLSVRTRAEIARALQPRLLLSIHHNGGDTHDLATGPHPAPQVFHQVGSAHGRRTSIAVADGVAGALDPFGGPWVQNPGAGATSRESDDTPGRDYYGLLRYTTGVPAVLSEAAYLTGPDEARLLARPDVTAAEGDAIAAAIAATIPDRRSLMDEPATERLPLGPLSNSDAGCREPALV